MITQQDIDDFIADAGCKVEIDREGARFWHRNCANHLGGVMSEIKREPDKSLFECMYCAERAYYPVGGVGRIFSDPIAATQEQEDDHCNACNDTGEGQAPDSACPECSSPRSRKYRSEP